MLFPRIEKIGECIRCKRVSCPIYRSKVVAGFICRLCLVKTGEIIA